MNKLMNWVASPLCSPCSVDAEGRAMAGTLILVLIALPIGAVFGEAGVFLTLGPLVIYGIFKACRGDFYES